MCRQPHRQTNRELSRDTQVPSVLTTVNSFQEILSQVTIQTISDSPPLVHCKYITQSTNHSRNWLYIMTIVFLAISN